MKPKINIALVGAGRIADVHYPGYINNSRARLYAVCDSDEALARRRQKEWRCKRSFTDYQQLLADPDLDAVEILTPQHLHLPMVEAAARAGKHIAVQKPMTTSLPLADRMIRACREAGVVFKVTDNYLFYPPLQKARELIQSGRIGEPSGVRIKLISGGKGGWPIPPAAWQWRLAEKEQGRGLQTFDHGHHLWTTAWYLLGDFYKVKAWIDYADGIIDCPATVIWRYAVSKAHGVCEFQHSPELRIPSQYYANDEWMEITGTRGILFIHRCTGEIHQGPVLSVFDDQGMQSYDQIPSDWVEGFKGSLMNFVDAIEGRADPLLTGAAGRHILSFSLAAGRSAALGREVYLSEMDAFWPGLEYHRQRSRERRRHPRHQARSRLWQWFGAAADARYADQAADLTRELLAAYDPHQDPDWSALVVLRLTGQGSVGDQIFCIQIGDGKAGFLSAEKKWQPDLEIVVPAGTWAMILLKKKRIETAFLQRKVKILTGKAEEALKLRAVFGL
ncbi:MAG: Gfo/Idh/MocA family oxidoreductase [Leptospiraceae bacterium]|nr:Gfo/Idh/MocA family oxidoreductase [Leptospiraceae bacterium]